MKKKVLCWCFMLIFAVQTVGAVKYNTTGRWNLLQQLERENSVRKLEQLDIVRNPSERWTQDSLIQRRDAFKMAYIVKTGGRELHENGDEPDISIPFIEQRKKTLRLYGLNPDFTDIEQNTFDYYFVDSLLAEKLLYGTNSSDGSKAELDRSATYDEALAIIGRLFYQVGSYSYGELITEDVVDENAAHPYFEFARQLGLINSPNPVDLSCPQIQPEQLAQPIPAYEFMHLLHRALYIPYGSITCFSVSLDERYIDNFVEKKDGSSYREDIVD